MGLGAYFNFNKSSKTKEVTKASSNSSLVNPISTLTSTYITKGTPVWKNFSELIYLLDCYYSNPIVQAVINTKVEAFANIRFSVKDLESGEIVPLEEYDKDDGKLNQLISQPNPLQSTTEWLTQLKVNKEIFGNSYTYASIPSGFRFKSYKDINVLNNLPSYCVTPELTGNWLEATTKEEIIKQYVLNDLNGVKRDLPTNTIFHTNNANVKLDKNFTEGVSNLIALKYPISNIEAAYESKNVMIRKRGALGILSSDQKDDAVGTVPLGDKDIKKVQDSFKKYGLMDDQYQQIISHVPLKYQKMAMSVKDLMLFEEVSHSGIAVCHGFGVPEDLVKYYIKTGTLGTDSNVSEKRLYDSTTIPESADFMNGLNNFLKTKNEGIELLGTFDHVKVLQKNKKEEAEVKKLNTQAGIEAFKIGAITYDDLLACMDMPDNPTIGSKYIWDLDDNQRNAIGINNKSKTESNEGADEQND